jgi:hypothetical protein
MEIPENPSGPNSRRAGVRLDWRPLGWVVAGQLFSLANKLPEYRENLQAKIKSVWKPFGKGLDRNSATVRELNEQLGDPQKAKDRIASAGANHTVITFAQGLEHLDQLEKALGSMAPTPERPLAVAR